MSIFFHATDGIDMPAKAQHAIIVAEGEKYTDLPKDPGGPTKYGWTLRSYRNVANRHATKYDIMNLSKYEALKLYEIHFWKKNNDDKIKNKKLAATLFLAQVNLGPSRPNKLLQNMVNDYCPRNIKFHSKTINYNLKVDGIIGSKTIEAVNNCKYVWPGYPYVLYYLYHSSPSIAPVWKWARRGLTNRIFYILHMGDN